MGFSLRLFVCICFIGLLSCSPIKYVPVHTTIENTTVYHDTLIKTYLVPTYDSIYVADTTSFIKNKYASTKAVYSNGHLLHTLRITAEPIYLTLSLPKTTRLISDEVPLLVEKPLTKWQSIKMEVGGYAIFVMILSLVFLVIYIIRRLI